jgi:TetR/AcrR family transcriptional regulator, transcriptional repressor for nem operon
MRYAAEHKERTRELILDQAAKAIRGAGPDGVSVADVMKRAGLTHGGFYAHFESKDALLAAAIERMFQTVRDRWAHETLDRQPKAALAAYLDWYLSTGHRDHRDTGCPVAALATDLPRMSSGCRLAFSGGVRRMTGTIDKMLARAGIDDSTATASSLVAELVGAVSLARAEPDRGRSDAILASSRTSIGRRLGLRT